MNKLVSTKNYGMALKNYLTW